MAFDISYVFTAKDKYTAIAKKVAASNQKIKSSAASAAASLKGNLVPSLASVNAAALRTKMRMKELKGSFEGISYVSEKIRNVGLGMSAAITLPAALMSKSLINAASDAEEVSDKFNMVFESLGAKGPQAAEALAKKYQLASSTSKELLSTTGAILSATGLQDERILQLSSSIGGLSIDLASFHNFTGSAADASLILTKALQGEAETLKTNFGITIQQNKAFQDAVKQKQKLTGSTLQAAKAEVIFAEVMRQATAQKALDNFNITLESYANQQRVASEATKQMKESFGKILLPIATKAMKVFASLAKRFEALSPRVKKIAVISIAVAAALGPLLLIVGSIGLALPFITAGFSALGVAMALVASPIGLVILAIAALGVAFLAVKKNWVPISDAIGGTIEQIGINFTLLWAKIKTGFKSFISFFKPAIDLLLYPLMKFIELKEKATGMLSGLFGSGAPQEAALKLVPSAIKEPSAALKLVPSAIKASPAITASPAVATANANANASVNGRITVSASEGSRVDSIESTNSFSGAKGNIGIGAAG